MTTPIADAALLAAGAGYRTAISPKDLELGPAWLDLRGVAHHVAAYRAMLASYSLRACLSLQSESLLFITVDPLSIDSTISEVASRFTANDWPDIPIAVVRGEDRFMTLEELMAAGVDLRSHRPPFTSLREERDQLASAVAAAPPSILRDAIEAGAKVVISHTADRKVLEDAIDGKQDPPGPHTLTLRFSNRYEMTVAFDDPRPVQQLQLLINEHLPEGVESSLNAAQNVKLLRLSATECLALVTACDRCDLLLEGLPTLSQNFIREFCEEWIVPVPAEHLEFGYDLRPASEWPVGL